MVAEYDAKPREIRNFVIVQFGLTTSFLLLLMWMFDGIDADLPPIWLWVVLLLPLGVAAFFAERVWLTTPSLRSDDPDPEGAGLAIFAGQTVRKLAYCEAPILWGVLWAFLSDYAAWPIIIAGVPGLLILAFEIWPSARNLSLTEAVLDASGANTRLLVNFGH